MGYYWNVGSAADLNSLVPQAVLGVNLFTGSSNPITLDDFDTLLSLTEGEVGAACAEGGYSFPVATVASVAFNYVKGVVADGAIANALELIPGKNTTATRLRNSYDTALTLIREGKMTLLAAAALTDDQGGRQGMRGGGIASPMVSASWFP